MKVLVSAGSFASDEGALIAVDLAAERAELVLRHRPPAHLRVAGKGWTGACWVPDTGDLLVCGFAAIFRVDTRRWQVSGTLHQPCMNDLHHVSATGQRVLVANTGLDAVDEFTIDGRFIGSHACQPGWLAGHRQAGRTPARAEWDRLLQPGWAGDTLGFVPETPPGTYYGDQADHVPFHRRRVRDVMHPNHVVERGARLLCTGLATRSVIDVRRFETVVRDTPGHPHDGVVHDDMLWLTTVNGWVLGYPISDQTGDAGPWPEVARHDVFAGSGRFGWCRGLRVTAEHLIVGLTAIHGGSRFPWNDRHPDRGPGDTESSLLCLERASGRLLSRVDLSAIAGWHEQTKLYSILELS